MMDCSMMMLLCAAQNMLWWQKVAKNGVGAEASSDMDTDMDSDSAATRSIFWDPSQQNH